MTQSEAGASSDFDVALSVAQEILRLISGPKAILSPDGRALAESPKLDDAFQAALRRSTEASPPSLADEGLSEAVFGPGSPLAGCRLIKRLDPPSPTLDPMLLHDLRDLLHSLQLRVDAGASASAGQDTEAQIAKIATQVETLLLSDSDSSPLRLGAELRDLCETLKPAIAAQGARLKLDLPAEEIEITLPRGALQRLVQNLLLNAAQQSRGGEITLTLRPAAMPEGGPQLEVADCGPGLPADRLAWLSAPQSPAPEPQGGHGYGLSIIRRALKQIGARLEQIDGPPHRLRVHLPGIASQDREIALFGREIWLAENNATAAALIERRLIASGARCQIFPSGEALIEAASESETPPALVLCDYFVGDYNGAELCRLLTSSGFAAPVIILTADDSAETSALSRLSGAAEVWLKPLSGTALIERVGAFLTSDKTAPIVPIFDPEIAPELLEEAGIARTVDFMRRALDEARGIAPLCAEGDAQQTRSALHSAIGASAITGLQLLNYRLKSLHTMVVANHPMATELEELDYSIDWTSCAIDKIETSEIRMVPKH